MSMRLVDKLAVPAIVIAGGMVYFAEQFDMPSLIPIAVALFGAFALLLGADTFIQGRIQLFDRLYSRRESYSGLSARLLGVVVFLFGAILIFYAGWEWLMPGKAGEFLAGLVKTERGLGIFLIVFGSFTFLFGLIRLISGSAHSPAERSAWVDFGFRFQGLIGFVVGILLLIAGGWLFIK